MEEGDDQGELDQWIRMPQRNLSPGSGRGGAGGTFNMGIEN